MPTTYAHWRFGQECIDTMPEDLKQIVKNNINIFNLGVHGPDIFFYDLTHKDVAKYGDYLHTISGKEFFEGSKAVYENNEEKEMMLAYLLGFLSHFTLDSSTHSYVERKKEVSGISHNKIESEWDGHVIISDQRMVNLVDRSESLRPNKEIAKVLAHFFPFDEKTMLRTTKLQHFFIHFLNYISVSRYKFLHALCLKLNLNDYADLLISPVELEACIDSNMRLDKLKVKARKLYPKLLKNFMDYLNNDKPLPAYFAHNFEQWPDYQNIPVLSPEEEMEYVVK